MVSGGKEKGHYVPDVFLVIGKKGKKQKCQQIQKKTKYLSIRESLSAGVVDSRMFVSCFWLNGVTFVRSLSKSCLSICIKFVKLCGASEANSYIKAWCAPNCLLLYMYIHARAHRLGRLLSRRILSAALAIIIKHILEIATSFIFHFAPLYSTLWWREIKTCRTKTCRVNKKTHAGLKHACLTHACQDSPCKHPLNSSSHQLHHKMAVKNQVLNRKWNKAICNEPSLFNSVSCFRKCLDGICNLICRKVCEETWRWDEPEMSHVMRKSVFAICEQQRRRSACAFAQSDQHLCCSLPGYYNTSTGYSRNFKSLASPCSWTGQFFNLTWSKTPKTGFLVRGSIKVP